jgi:hypothetical protein
VRGLPGRTRAVEIGRTPAGTSGTSARHGASRGGGAWGRWTAGGIAAKRPAVAGSHDGTLCCECGRYGTYCAAGTRSSEAAGPTGSCRVGIALNSAESAHRGM